VLLGENMRHRIFEYPRQGRPRTGGQGRWHRDYSIQATDSIECLVTVGNYHPAIYPPGDVDNIVDNVFQEIRDCAGLSDLAYRAAGYGVDRGMALMRESELPGRDSPQHRPVSSHLV
jgi:hypothetical protein